MLTIFCLLLLEFCFGMLNMGMPHYAAGIAFILILLGLAMPFLIRADLNGSGLARLLPLSVMQSHLLNVLMSLSPWAHTWRKSRDGSQHSMSSTFRPAPR